jgi:ATP-dependent Clp protease ATP-binding subunit ClpC
MEENAPTESLFQILKRWLLGKPAEQPVGTFTPRAQQNLKLASQAARDRNHPEVLVDHVFLGILILNRSVAVDVLRRLGCKLATLREVTETTLDSLPKLPASKTPVYAKETKLLLTEAFREAMQMNHTSIGSEHLLLGVLTQKDSPCCKMLEALDLNLQLVRNAVLHELDPNIAPDSPGRL